MKKWRNKITGEINEFMVHKRIEDSEDGNPVYAPFDGDIDEWEDYEEPKNPYFINWFGEVSELLGHISDREIEKLKEAGNYFETKEEAEKAVEKLKAWKRLEDKGFEFEWVDKDTGSIKFAFFNREGRITKEMWQDIDLLFGGEK